MCARTILGRLTTTHMAASGRSGCCYVRQEADNRSALGPALLAVASDSIPSQHLTFWKVQL